MREQERTTTLPGVLATIAAGFDLTARHLWLLLLPVILDTFYWLGPRLRFQTLIEQLLAMLPEEAEVLDLASQLGQVAPQTNLATTLTVQLVGVPALMAGFSPKNTPVASQVIDVDNWLTWFGLFATFTVIGLLLTAVYYTLIASAVKKQSLTEGQLNPGKWAKRAVSSWLRLIGLLFLFLSIIMILYIPLIMIGTILFMINSTLGAVSLLLGPFLAIWIVIYLSLAPQGIVLNGRPLLRAVIESIRLVQANFPSILLLLIAMFFIGAILDLLLFSVENGSWLTLVNILGHAFVSTALVAALFIFYRDRYQVLLDPDAAFESRPLQNSEQ
jgi:hypothetical protein